MQHQTAKPYQQSRKGSIIAIAIYTSLLLMVMGPMRVYAGPVLRNWFGSNFQFSTSLRGSTRYYDLDNIGCDFRAYTDSGTGAASNTFSVTLMRDRGLWRDDCGKKTASRNGSSHFDWYGVGAGDYYFYFSKANDGQTVKCDAVGMYSW